MGLPASRELFALKSAVLVHDAHLAVLLAVVGGRPISASQATPKLPRPINRWGGGGGLPEPVSPGKTPNLWNGMSPSPTGKVSVPTRGWNRDGRLAVWRFGAGDFDD